MCLGGQPRITVIEGKKWAHDIFYVQYKELEERPAPFLAKVPVPIKIPPTIQVPIAESISIDPAEPAQSPQLEHPQHGVYVEAETYQDLLTGATSACMRLRCELTI